MGQKVHPTGLRLGISLESNANWYPSESCFANTLRSDIQLREYIKKFLPDTAAISKILIERTGKNVKVTIFTAKPAVIIGKKGEDVEKLRLHVTSKLSADMQSAALVQINIEEVRKPEIEAALVSESIAQQLEKRVMFRRAMRRAVTSAMRQGAKGIKVELSGRLGGAEIARTEWYREGRLPLQTLRARIDYGTAIAKTTYGIIGVKVWINRGEFLNKQKEQQESSVEETKA